ncbi:hypothetical protein [Vitiosangium sp. GDMCC 1.1324]|uniref:hypothetical protein n=1 Tax=Vitiosangium sp. (strain GDMCC 1.1324) TaxID=2138576 RepID=UPI000D3D0659|nr:hypothetical protein [Vitiosangium sp. GDMCC 1.1324]PTL82665.1 hypothetical protein DAT35_17925 [Vitiosangium sp. GDMCC 1.1324]
MKMRHFIGMLVLLGAPRALAQSGEAQTQAPTAEPFALRLGLSARPLIGLSGLSAIRTHTLRDGGWVVADVAPSYRLSRFFAAELGLSAMVPVKDAWGFPDFRLAVTPAARLDAGPLYLRVGVPLMFGEGFSMGAQAAVGATLFNHFYVGVVGEANVRDLLGMAGLELGVRLGGPKP